MRCCFSLGIAAIVRMLCSRSASLMIRHPQVAGHRHQHLAHRGGLLRLLGVELQPFELGDAVDDRGDLGAERRLDVGERDLGVFDRVVQQRGGERDLVEADVGDDAGDRQRVVDVALATAARLVTVGFRRRLVGAVDHRHRRLRMAAAVRAEQRRQLIRGDVLVPPPREAHDRRQPPATPQYLARLSTRWPSSLARPPRSSSSIRKPTPTTTPPSASTSRTVAAAVPPVASTSSMTRICSPGMDRVAVDLELVLAVLERVVLAHDRPWQLAGLANRHEPGPHAVRDRRGDDEAARLHAEHAIGAARRRSGRPGRRSIGEGIAVTEQRRDVAEADARRREVVDVADEFGEPVAVRCHTASRYRRSAGATLLLARPRRVGEQRLGRALRGRQEHLAAAGLGAMARRRPRLRRRRAAEHQMLELGAGGVRAAQRPDSEARAP